MGRTDGEHWARDDRLHGGDTFDRSVDVVLIVEVMETYDPFAVPICAEATKPLFKTTEGFTPK